MQSNGNKYLAANTTLNLPTKSQILLRQQMLTHVADVNSISKHSVYSVIGKKKDDKNKKDVVEYHTHYHWYEDDLEKYINDRNYHYKHMKKNKLPYLPYSEDKDWNF